MVSTSEIQATREFGSSQLIQHFFSILGMSTVATAPKVLFLSTVGSCVFHF